MNIWKTPISLDSIRERNKNTLMEVLEINFTEVGENFLKATMPVNEKTRQPLGILHGGASCVLAETIGSTAANYALDISKELCVGLSINTHHIKSIRSGKVTGIATPVHIGRSTHLWNIDIFNDEENLISTSRLTMAVLSRDRLLK